MLNPYGDDIEVWRCSAESQDVDGPSFHVIQEAKPTVHQLAASAAATGKYGASSSRGNFLPWAHIERADPAGGSPTRFSFPFFGETNVEEIYIWDVRTGALVQTMLNIQQINYVDDDGIVSSDGDEDFWDLGEFSNLNLTERYVFVCGNRLRVFDRSVRGVVRMGRERAVHVEDIVPHDAFGKWCFTVATDDSGEIVQKHHIEGALVVEHETVLTTSARYEDEVVTVYISSCGSHAAILLLASKILVKPYFEDDFAGRIPSEWNMSEIDLSPDRKSVV